MASLGPRNLLFDGETTLNGKKEEQLKPSGTMLCNGFSLDIDDRNKKYASPIYPYLMLRDTFLVITVNGGARGA